MPFEPTHIIEYLQVHEHRGFSFTPGDINTDERIVREMVSEVKFPDYGFPRKVAGWKVTEVSTGRVLDSDNWPSDH